jgi:alpha-tubulin suppressor-like RCC1 family protein
MPAQRRDHGCLRFLHTCVVLPEGTVKCWGRNLEYQLGTGNDTPSDVPIPVLFLDVYP